MNNLHAALGVVQQQEQIAGLVRQFHAHAAAATLAQLMGVEYQRQLAMALEAVERQRNLAPDEQPPERIEINPNYAAVVEMSVLAADALCAGLNLPLPGGRPTRQNR